MLTGQKIVERRLKVLVLWLMLLPSRTLIQSSADLLQKDKGASLLAAWIRVPELTAVLSAMLATMLQAASTLD